MVQLSIFLSTFVIVFIGELGDKSQVTAGTGTLAYGNNVRIIFFSSALALTCVAGMTVFGAGLIPSYMIPSIAYIGGALLIVYGAYLYKKVGSATADETALEEGAGWKLFTSHFAVVFIAELGDKTQITTLGIAVENQAYLVSVFAASALALITVTGLTVWGVTKVPRSAIPNIQKFGAVLMILYGVYMLFGEQLVRVL